MGKGRKPTKPKLKIVQGGRGKPTAAKAKPSNVTAKTAAKKPAKKKPTKAKKPKKSDPRTIQPPGFLNEKGVEWFIHLTKQLELTGNAEQAFSEVHGLAADRLAEIEDCNVEIETYGMVYQTKSTTGDTVLKANPAVGQRDRAQKHLHSLLAEMGLTHTAINKLGGLNPPDEDDEFSDYG